MHCVCSFPHAKLHVSYRKLVGGSLVAGAAASWHVAKVSWFAHKEDGRLEYVQSSPVIIDIRTSHLHVAW